MTEEMNTPFEEQEPKRVVAEVIVILLYFNPIIFEKYSVFSLRYDLADLFKSSICDGVSESLLSSLDSSKRRCSSIHFLCFSKNPSINSRGAKRGALTVSTPPFTDADMLFLSL